MPMAEAWQRIWAFSPGNGLFTSAQQRSSSTRRRSSEHTVLPRR